MGESERNINETTGRDDVGMDVENITCQARWANEWTVDKRGTPEAEDKISTAGVT